MRGQIEATSSLPALWTSAPLRELCSFHNGLWKGKKAPFETVNVIRNTNFKAGGRIDLTDVAVLEVEARQFAKRRLLKNDIIIEKSGGGPKQPVGRVVLFDLDSGNYSFSNFTSAIRVEDVQRIHPIFLHRVLYYWYLSGKTEPLQRHSTGIRNLDFDNYKELHVPLPPLEEQKRIVAVLDQAFAALDRARAHAEANLTDAKEMFDSWLSSAFEFGHENWPKKKLPDIAENLDRLRVPITKKDRRSGDVPYYGASGVVDHVQEHIFNEDLLLVSEDGANLLARTYPIAFSISGKAWVNNHAHVLRFGDLDSQEFVRLYLNSIDLEPWVSGMAQPKLNQKALSSIPIPFPGIADRSRIVEEAVDVWRESQALARNYDAQLTDIADLRQSLLQKAFSGQLTA
ncbi:restriction endonuclease subunit S [Paracoccus sanguinis]|uniref:Type I restriction enzyme, S subunit n=1 Tax=Paracoccus sanguinis TaxID=1545044 RepID=A0A1H2XL43_9RHOB|nr:restriction endonuclease subunit S [Paracoccus sanguinis]SDW93592.1 type I restriction enzyme, S subunit [Paracoccus sanguinis]